MQLFFDTRAVGAIQTKSQLGGCSNQRIQDKTDQTGRPSACSQSRPNQLILSLSLSASPQSQLSAWCARLHVSKLPRCH